MVTGRFSNVKSKSIPLRKVPLGRKRAVDSELRVCFCMLGISNTEGPRAHRWACRHVAGYTRSTCYPVPRQAHADPIMGQEMDPQPTEYISKSRLFPPFSSSSCPFLAILSFTLRIPFPLKPAGSPLYTEPLTLVFLSQKASLSS